MLKSIDVLIGLSVVMLVLSMVLTLVTEAITKLFNSRGVHLLAGIAGLLKQIDPALTDDLSKEIAKAVLTHPLIQEMGGRCGSVIHREELISILFEMAAGQGSQKLTDTARAALDKALKANGIQDSAAVLDNARYLALQIEAARPDLATNARQNIAFLREANSKFLAKVHGWFDQTIDRVSARFTITTRMITIIAAAVLVTVIQLDTVALVNRLATDPKLRAELVEQGQKLSQAAPTANAEAQKQEVAALSATDVITIPASYSEWKSNWTRQDTPPTPAGLILSIFLLSLGAPFWYNALKDTIRLRSVVQATDDAQREIRQGTQPAPAAAQAADAAAAAAITREQDDLGSLGV